jgi:hypothetical protein
MVDLFKQIAVEAVECEKPVVVMLGTVDGSDVVIEQRLKLSGEQLVVMKNVELKNKDTVVLLREQGGQRFIVLGVV